MIFQEPREAEWIQQRAREIVAGLKPAAQEKGWFRRWWEQLEFGKHVGSLIDDHWIPIRMLLYGLAAAVVIGLIWLLVRELELGRRRRADGVSKVRQVDARERVEELLARARAARTAGQRLAALRLFFSAYVVGLSRCGDIEFRESWTNQEIVQRGAHSQDLRASLAPLVFELDGLVYGGREVTEAHLDRLEQLCLRIVA